MKTSKFHSLLMNLWIIPYLSLVVILINETDPHMNEDITKGKHSKRQFIFRTSCSREIEIWNPSKATYLAKHNSLIVALSTGIILQTMFAWQTVIIRSYLPYSLQRPLLLLLDLLWHLMKRVEFHVMYCEQHYSPCWN